MNDRLSDETIAAIRADAETGVADCGHGAEPTQEQILAMAREVQDARRTGDEVRELGRVIITIESVESGTVRARGLSGDA